LSHPGRICQRPHAYCHVTFSYFLAKLVLGLLADGSEW
jgi:hypothetical protein